ncbi:PH domain-containing protein [Candidatus Gracilibacteria bacterium]|nr:PH domain-containing protein [Candidatus Gracilibacteria bacterium]
MKLKENEKILEVFTPNYFTKIILFIYLFISILITLSIYYLFDNYQFIEVFCILSILLFIVGFYYLFIYFELMTVVLTNFKIIYVKKNNLFESKYESINYSEITKIKASQNGFLKNYFGYGEIILFSKDKEIILKYINFPLENAKKINTFLK